MTVVNEKNRKAGRVLIYDDAQRVAHEEPRLGAGSRDRWGQDPLNCVCEWTRLSSVSSSRFEPFPIPFSSNPLVHDHHDVSRSRCHGRRSHSYDFSTLVHIPRTRACGEVQRPTGESAHSVGGLAADGSVVRERMTTR